MATRTKRSEKAKAPKQIEDLYIDLLDALYEQASPELARPIADRLETLLQNDTRYKGSIRLEELRSLIAESRGEVGEAIRCREREIRKILELHNLAASGPEREYVLKKFDHTDVSDRFDILSTLYADSGDLRQAVETLRDSKSYCKAHDVPFDGDDLLQEYEANLALLANRNGKEAPRGTRRTRPPAE